MIYYKHIPNFLIKNYVDSILYLEGNNKGAGLPKTNMSLVFNLADNFKLFENKGFTSFTNYQKYWIAGLQMQPRFVESYGSSKMIVVQFKSHNVFPILKIPLRYFTDNYILLDDLSDFYAEETWQKLCEAKTILEKMQITEAYLQYKLQNGRDLDRKMLNVSGVFSMVGQNSRIKDICRQANISRKHLNFLFSEFIGVSPKNAFQLHRFQKVLKELVDLENRTLTDLAYQHDYFDQAHFISDFKRFAGLTPTEYLKLSKIIPTLKVIPHFIPAQ